MQSVITTPLTNSASGVTKKIFSHRWLRSGGTQWKGWVPKTATHDINRLGSAFKNFTSEVTAFMDPREQLRYSSCCSEAELVKLEAAARHFLYLSMLRQKSKRAVLQDMKKYEKQM